jgi:hypothetical protein
MAPAVQLPARFANRQNKRSVVAAVSEGLGMATPPYVSIKGGNFTLVDANGEQEPVETKHLDCVIIDTSLPSRVYWGDKKYNPNADTYEPPVCFSDNGIGASANSTLPQSQSCQTCPQNVWGSATSNITGKGVKACHIIKKVAIVPVEGKVSGDGSYVPEFTQDFPFLLRVPVMSHENLRAYSAKFAGQDFDVSDVVTRITFVHGQVGQLDFAAAGFTDQPTEDLVQKFLAAKLTDGLVGRGDVPWRGEVRQIERTPDQSFGQQSLPQAQQGAAQAQPAHPIPPAAPTPFGAAGGAAQEPEAPKRTRRTKAQMEADTAPQAQQVGSGIPPFLQRQATPAAPNGLLGGIHTDAPAPNAELESALANVFGLKTGA